MTDLKTPYHQCRRILMTGLLFCAASVGWAALSPQNMAEIQSGMQTSVLFRGLPLGGDQGVSGGRSVREIESAIRRQQSYIRELERKLDRASSDYSSYKDNERRRIANGGRVSRAGISGGKLRTVQMFERLLRENERTLEQLQSELDAARAREEKATAVMEATSTETTSSAEPKSNRFCTECGAKAAKDAKFCGACGRKL